MRRSTCPEYVRSFLDHWRPDLAVFTELEIWPNLILESSARGIPLTLVNARMTKRSYPALAAQPRHGAAPVQPLLAGAGAERDAAPRRFKTLGARQRGGRRQPQDRHAAAAGECRRAGAAEGGARRAPAAGGGEHARGRGGHRRRRAPRSCASACPTCAPSSRRAIPSAAQAIARMLQAQGTGRGAALAGRPAGPRPAMSTSPTRMGELGMLYKLVARRLHRRVAGRPRRPQPDRGRAPRRRRHHRAALAELLRHLSRADRPPRGASWCAPRRSSPAPPAGCSPTRPSWGACAPAPATALAGPVRRAAAHGRGAAALPAGRGRACACGLTSRRGGTAPPPVLPGVMAGVMAGAWRRWARSTAGRRARATPASRPTARRLPVICVGNLTAGGTGKTPLALHLCERLQRPAGARSALTRGYGGRRPGRIGSAAATAPTTSATRRCCWRARRRRWSPATGPAMERARDRGRAAMPTSSSWTTACRTRSSPRT